MIGITNAGGKISKFGIRVLHDFPANPKEGDIVIYFGINSAIGEITPWGISEERVDQTADGYTFINIGTVPHQFAVTFWASLHPKDPSLGLSCYWGPVYQKINGKYKRMKAMLRAGGEWKQISDEYNGELFYQGNQHTDVTGGWTGMVRNPDVSTNVADPANPNLYSDANAVEGGTAWFRTVNKVDMTNYRTLKWAGWGFGENSGGKYGAHCTVHDNPSTDSGIISDVSFQNEGTYSMDISGISGAHYITFRAMGSGAQRVSISKVWMG